MCKTIWATVVFTCLACAQTPGPAPDAGGPDTANIGSTEAADMGTSTTAIVVFADQDWYRSRTEPERVWTGRFEKNPEPSGQLNTRSRPFVLESGGDKLLVYAAAVDQLLAPLVGRQVEGRGKVVDIGFGPELWLATIAARD